jgi:hypothetical protein
MDYEALNNKHEYEWKTLRYIETYLYVHPCFMEYTHCL